jgi:hypothetical protein
VTLPNPIQDSGNAIDQPVIVRQRKPRVQYSPGHAGAYPTASPFIFTSIPNPASATFQIAKEAFSVTNRPAHRKPSRILIPEDGCTGWLLLSPYAVKPNGIADANKVNRRIYGQSEPRMEIYLLGFCYPK